MASRSDCHHVFTLCLLHPKNGKSRIWTFLVQEILGGFRYAYFCYLVVWFRTYVSISHHVQDETSCRL